MLYCTLAFSDLSLEAWRVCVCVCEAVNVITYFSWIFQIQKFTGYCSHKQNMLFLDTSVTSDTESLSKIE